MRPQAIPTLAAVAVVFAACLAPRAARAQAASCTVHDTQEARQQEARAQFESGQSLAEGQQFDAALAAYECSFRNVPHPSTLYNIARAAELSGAFRRALDAWRGYLRMAPEAEDRADIERRISALESAASSGSAPPPTGAQPTGAQPTGAQPGVQGTGAQAGYQATPPPAAAAAPQQWQTPEGAPTDVYQPAAPGQEYQVVERRPPSPWRYYAWYIMGTGIVSALLGIYFVIPEATVDVCDIYEPGTTDFNPTNPCAVTGYAFMGLGAALMLSAAMIWIFAEPGGEYVVTRRAGLAPRLALDADGRVSGATASLFWSF